MHLILGNRDINKMRLTAELHPDGWEPADTHPGVYWRQRRPELPRGTPALYLADQPEGMREDSRASRLRYTLAETMGSPKAFEQRRAELAAERGWGGDGGVTDECVLESYLRSLEPGGLMRTYLQQAQRATYLGRTSGAPRAHLGCISSGSAGFNHRRHTLCSRCGHQLQLRPRTRRERAANRRSRVG